MPSEYTSLSVKKILTEKIEAIRFKTGARSHAEVIENLVEEKYAEVLENA